MPVIEVQLQEGYDDSALSDPCVLVKQFLEHLGDRRLSDAKMMVSENFVMQFPGAAPMQDSD